MRKNGNGMRVEAGSRSVDNYLQQLNGEASADNRQCQRPDQFASAKAGRKDPEQGHGEEYLHSAQLRERYQRRDAGRMRGSPSYEVADDNHVGPEGRTADAREVTIAMQAIRSGDASGAEKTLLGTALNIDQGKK